MRLISIHIEGYRSVADSSLEDCGNLNVLIGKNNAGKSNLLSAVELFFRFLDSPTLVATMTPPVSAPTDWFSNGESTDITITALLGLSDMEVSNLHGAIASEAPQMRNALDDLASIRTVECELKFDRTTSLGYVRRISFCQSKLVRDIFRIS